jgi:hypothetical protein
MGSIIHLLFALESVVSLTIIAMIQDFKILP